MNSCKSHGPEDSCEQIPCLYVHVYHDGEILLLTEDSVVTLQAEAEQLKTEIARIEEAEGLIRFSFDQDDEPSEEVQEIVGFISNANAIVEVERYPLPVVYGYYRSYSPYIADAIEVAEMDIEAIQFNLHEDEELLKSMETGSTEHAETEERINEIAKRLEFAQYAMTKLQELALDICSETEGGEH